MSAPAPRSPARLIKEATHRAAVTLGAAALTLALLLVLPLFQVIASAPAADLMVREIGSADVPPPPPPPEPEPEKEKEPEPEEPPPELSEPVEPLDLAQLDVALNATLGAGDFAGDFGTKLAVAATARAVGAGGEEEDLVSIADLDQKPRVIHQPGPVVDAVLRHRVPATVTVLFTVDAEGRVVAPVVQSATDQAFERAALTAVKQWRFEPGKRAGRPVSFRMRVPISFPKGS